MKSRAACSLPALIAAAPVGEISELDFAVGAWAEILEPIHTEWLNECYKRAMRNYQEHGERGPFTASHIYEVWRMVNASGDYTRWLQEQRRALLETTGDVIPPPPEFKEALQNFLRRATFRKV